MPTDNASIHTDEYMAMRQRIIDATRPLVARRERGDKYEIGDNANDFLKLEEIVKHDRDKSLWAFAVECGMERPKAIYEYTDTAKVVLPQMRKTIQEFMPHLRWSHERNIARHVKEQRDLGVILDDESVMDLAKAVNDNHVPANEVGKFLTAKGGEVWVQQREYYPGEYQRMVESGVEGFVDVVYRIPVGKADALGDVLSAKDARMMMSVSYMMKAEKKEGA